MFVFNLREQITSQGSSFGLVETKCGPTSEDGDFVCFREVLGGMEIFVQHENHVKGSSRAGFGKSGKNFLHSRQSERKCN